MRLKIVGSPVALAMPVTSNDFKSEEIDKVSTITGILRKSNNDAGVSSPVDSSLMFSKRKREGRGRSAHKVRWSDQNPFREFQLNNTVQEAPSTA